MKTTKNTKNTTIIINIYKIQNINQ